MFLLNIFPIQQQKFMSKRTYAFVPYMQYVAKIYIKQLFLYQPYEKPILGRFKTVCACAFLHAYMLSLFLAIHALLTCTLPPYTPVDHLSLNDKCPYLSFVPHSTCNALSTHLAPTLNSSLYLEHSDKTSNTEMEKAYFEPEKLAHKVCAK